MVSLALDRSVGVKGTKRQEDRHPPYGLTEEDPGKELDPQVGGKEQDSKHLSQDAAAFCTSGREGIERDSVNKETILQGGGEC